MKDIDPEGKKLDQVSWLHCESESFMMNLILDINIQIYPVDLGEKFWLVIASTLCEDDTLDDGEYNPTEDRPSRADQFEYVKYGEVYKIEGVESSNMFLCLHVLWGPVHEAAGYCQHPHVFEVDSRIYQMKKLAFWTTWEA